MNSFNTGTNEEKAQRIANYCNQNGISKMQLQQLMGMLKK